MSNTTVARINGAKSNGPITPEGKARSTQNSTKHGLTSSRVVLPHESQEDYDELEASFKETFKPYGAVENELVEEMSASRWRLRRIELMESALLRKAMKQQREAQGPDADETEVQMAAFADVAESKAYANLLRHSAQLRRSYEKAWKELERIQEHRLAQCDDSEENAELQNEPSACVPHVSLEAQINALMMMPPPRSSRSDLGTPLDGQGK